ncbi:MAG TPA: thioesterase family protein [Microvirga sp.]|jgi:acyl-CoA thioesterase FadM
MNLWLRLLHLFLTAFRRPKLQALDVSRLSFRVWPHDLDTSLHMNNGRYWTLMDQGRADLMIRTGLWRAILKHGWTPVVSAAKIRFRRELKPFQPFTLESRVITWAETWIVMEHRMVTRRSDGSQIVNAVALVRAGLYDRKARAFIAVDRLWAEIGERLPAPVPSADVEAFLAAEEAMKRAA